MNYIISFKSCVAHRVRLVHDSFSRPLPAIWVVSSSLLQTIPQRTSLYTRLHALVQRFPWGPLGHFWQEARGPDQMAQVEAFGSIEEGVGSLGGDRVDDRERLAPGGRSDAQTVASPRGNGEGCATPLLSPQSWQNRSREDRG